MVCLGLFLVQAGLHRIVDQVNYFGAVKVNLTDPSVDNLRSATTPCTSTMLPQINSMLAKGHSILQTQ